MKIFLSYASQDIESAKAIYLALRDQGHRVFFDRAELPAGDEYHNRIRAAVEKSRLFLFLISPNAIDGGSYTLTELDIADKAGKKILPVMLEKTPIEALPASIKAITFLQPDGSLPAAVAAEVHRIAGSLRRKRVKQSLAAVFLTGIVASVFFFTMNVLADIGDFNAYPNTSLLFTRSFIEKQRALAKNLLRSQIEAIHYVRTNREGSIKVLKKYLRVDDAEAIAATYDFFAQRTELPPRPNFEGIKSILTEMGAPQRAPGDFVDLSLLDEIEREGFLQRLR